MSPTQVNERLAHEALTDSYTTQFDEFVKVQWPPRTVCRTCHEVSRPQAGLSPQVHWRHAGVIKLLLEQYCLEPRFDCWSELSRLDQRPQAEISATLGAYSTAVVVLVFLVLACGCMRGRGERVPSSTKKKRDHVV